MLWKNVYYCNLKQTKNVHVPSPSNHLQLNLRDLDLYHTQFHDVWSIITRLIIRQWDPCQLREVIAQLTRTPSGATDTSFAGTRHLIVLFPIKCGLLGRWKDPDVGIPIATLNSELADYYEPSYRPLWQRIQMYSMLIIEVMFSQPVLPNFPPFLFFNLTIFSVGSLEWVCLV